MPPSPVRAIGIVSLLFALPAFAQFKTPSPSASIEQAAHASAVNAKQTPPSKETQYSPSKFEVLTDTKGYNLGPYLDNILSIVRNEWLAAGHQVVKKPNYRRGTVVAEFIIARIRRNTEFENHRTFGRRRFRQSCDTSFGKSEPLARTSQKFDLTTTRNAVQVFLRRKKPSTLVATLNLLFSDLFAAPARRVIVMLAFIALAVTGANANCVDTPEIPEARVQAVRTLLLGENTTAVFRLYAETLSADKHPVFLLYSVAKDADATPTVYLAASITDGDEKLLFTHNLQYYLPPVTRKAHTLRAQGAKRFPIRHSQARLSLTAA